MEPEIVVDYACALGEGPLWHPAEQRLYWTDIEGGALYWYDPSSGKSEKFYEGDLVGGFTFQADGGFLLFGRKGSVREWKDGKTTTLIEGLSGEEEMRFNDVIADPAGRVFCGTIGRKPGRLYRLDTNGMATVVLEGVGCSNGLGFTPDGRGMYYTDTVKRDIYLFDYDEATGEITNQRVFLHWEGEGGPDGMTVDSEGGVWSAFWGGSCVVRFDSTGHETHRISFPAKKMTSLVFGGPDFSDMYITSAGGTNRPGDGTAAGALFRIAGALGFTGRAEFMSRVRP
jgi:D-xylonolactonase